MNILAIIPARGGSKGIPRKNVRLLNNAPLISYAINNAKNSKYITDVYLSTEDEEIATVAAKYGCKTIKRENELAQDHITLDPVIHDAVLKVEKEKGFKYDIVITMQATSPLLKVETLDNAIKYFLEKNPDTILSVVNKPHLSWTNKNGEIVPNYEKRLNRQELPANYLETGSFIITKREFVQPNSRFGKKLEVYEISEQESIDIDSYADWAVCENVLNSKKIILRCDGNSSIGMNHINHCLTLAYHLTGHEILFVINEKHDEGIKRIKDAFFKYELIKDDDDFYELINKMHPDIIVNDCLDTTETYIKTLKKYCDKVITIDDLGTGSNEADICINALYNNEKASKNIYNGDKYIWLKDEFLIADSITPNEKVENILVVFEGADQNNLTQKVYDIAKHQNGETKYTILTDNKNITTIEDKNIVVVNNVMNVCKYMERADIAITNQGRTVCELASLGVPTIVIAKNERELLNCFATEENGFMPLGLADNITNEELEKEIYKLANDFNKRKEMNNKMLSKEIKKGITREINLILE